MTTSTRTTDAVEVSTRQRTDEGYLVLDATLARTGIQEYAAWELGVPTGFSMNDIIRVWRPPEEVSHADSLESLKFKPVTNEHPWQMVDIQTIKDVKVGTLGENVTYEDTDKTTGHVKGRLVIDDGNTIAEIEAGKVEISLGYFSDYDFTKGVTPDGEHFDAVQRNIRGNHVAIVGRGRCGDSCKVADSLDNGVPTMTHTVIKVAGIDCEMPQSTSQVVAKAMEDAKKDRGALEAERDDLKAKLDKVNKELDETKGERDQLKVDLTAAQDTAALDAKVAQRQEFIAKAKGLDANVDTAGKTSLDIMTTVLKSKFPNESFDGKSEDYITARFDHAATTTSAMDSAVADATKPPAATGDEPNALAARDAMIKRNAEQFGKQ